jgi:enoyl-CoA hydratase
MDEAIAIEEKLFGGCFGTADQREGMGAFLEKRRHEPYQNR